MESSCSKFSSTMVILENKVRMRHIYIRSTMVIPDVLDGDAFYWVLSLTKCSDYSIHFNNSTLM